MKNNDIDPQIRFLNAGLDMVMNAAGMGDLKTPPKPERRNHFVYVRFTTSIEDLAKSLAEIIADESDAKFVADQFEGDKWYLKIPDNMTIQVKLQSGQKPPEIVELPVIGRFELNDDDREFWIEDDMARRGRLIKTEPEPKDTGFTLATYEIEYSHA